MVEGATEEAFLLVQCQLGGTLCFCLELRGGKSREGRKIKL